MNALAIIKRDHRAVKTDYRLYRAARHGNEKMRLAKKICSALTAHAQMEEQVFYPAIQSEGNAKARKFVENSLAEHAEIKQFIGRLDAEATEPGFEMKMEEMIAGVLHHAGEEEAALLPEAKRSLGNDRLEELGMEMEELSPTRGVGRMRQVHKRLAAEGKLLIG